jgi:hypothetical protein
MMPGQTVPARQSASAGFAADRGTIGHVASFGSNQPNNLYIVGFDGDIFVIEPGRA